MQNTLQQIPRHEAAIKCASRAISCVLPGLLCLVTTSMIAGADEISDRYLVLETEGAVWLVDVETGYRWKRVDGKSGPPRWQKAERLQDRSATIQWVTAALRKEPASDDQKHEERKREREWVTDILCGSEYPGLTKSDQVVHRWVRSPTVSVFHGSSAQHKAVEEAVDHLRSTLKATSVGRIKVTKSLDTDADIEVHFLPMNKFADFAKEHDFKYIAGNHGCFAVRWDKKHRMTKGFVLLATDKLSGQKLKHFTLEEITQTLGPMNDSAMYQRSMFYSGVSAPSLLAPKDRQLMLLLYKQLKPGASSARVQLAFDRYWDKYRSPAASK